MAHSYAIKIEVPACAFRPYQSREYQDTYPAPPPATIYGMLLSLIGVSRQEKSRHRGCELALAMDQFPGRTQRSRVFRKLRRGGDLEDTRPDYQDLLLDFSAWIWLRPGTDKATPPLSELVHQAIANPATVDRSGGLSLGESSYLVDTIAIDDGPPRELMFMVRDQEGFYSLPTWVDHLSAANTILDRFSFTEPIGIAEGLANAWVRIGGYG